jgi:hypothetical protein
MLRLVRSMLTCATRIPSNIRDLYLTQTDLFAQPLQQKGHSHVKSKHRIAMITC